MFPVSSPVPVHLRLIRWFCGFTEDSEKHQREMEQHLEAVSSLRRTKAQKIILYINLAIILTLAVFLYAYFTVNPFTNEEIDLLRQKALAEKA